MSTMPLPPGLERQINPKPNIFDLMRIKSIFDRRPTEPSPTYDEPMMLPQTRTVNPLFLQTGGTNLDLEGYTPEAKANEEFANLLHSFPARENPGFMSKLMAALSQNQENAYPQFHRNLAEWKMKLPFYQQAADNETQQNINRRIMASTAQQNRIRQEDLDRKEAADKVREEQGSRRLDLMEYQNTVRAQIAKGGTITPDIDGSLYMVYKDGTKIPLDMKKVTPEFMEELKHSNRMEVVSAQTEAAKERSEIGKWDIRQTFDPVTKQPGPVYRINTATGEMGEIDIKGKAIRTAPIGSIARPQSAADRQKQIINNANQVKAANPKWSQWITVDRTGVKITKPSKGYFGTGIGAGPDDSTYEKIYRAIYGEDTTIKPSVSHNAETPKQFKAPDGEELVVLVNKSGKRVGVRKSMVDMALKQGYARP